MAINQGSILDHIDKPAIHPNDAVVQSLTATSNGKVEVTVNGVGVTDYVYAKGLIKCDGHADNFIAIQDGSMSGQEVYIQETGDTENVPLIVRNSSDNAVACVWPGETCNLKWYWTSTSAGTWYLTDQRYAPTATYYFNDSPAIGETIATGGGITATADAAVNGHHYPDGLSIYVRHDVGAALYAPTPVANGMHYVFDAANNDGWEASLANTFSATIYGGKIGRSTFTAQGPAFYVQAKISLDDVDGSDLWTLLGLRKVEAYQDGATTAGYNTYCAFAGIDANLLVNSELNGGGVGSDDTLTDLTDSVLGDTTVKIAVSDAGVVSYTLNGTTFTASNATLTFDDGDILTPFFSVLNDSNCAGLAFKELEVGYQ